MVEDLYSIISITVPHPRPDVGYNEMKIHNLMNGATVWAYITCISKNSENAMVASVSYTHLTLPTIYSV